MYRSFHKQFYLAWAYVLLLFGILGTSMAQAMTPAGTVIKNLATVTYQDSLGNEYTATSNESVVTVAEVYAALLEQDQTKDGAVGQTVYFPHQLTNNGNTEDSFTFVIADGGNSPVLTNLKLYHDLNGNGQPDAGDPQISGNFKVAAGAIANLVVAATVPVGATGKPTLTLTASSGNNSFSDGTVGSQVNTDTINVVADGPVLVTRKQVIEHIPATLTKAGTVKYRIEVTNNGTELEAGGIYDFFPDFMDLSGLDGTATADTRLGDIKIKAAADLKTELPAGTNYIAENTNTNGLYIPVTGLSSGASLAFEFTVKYDAKKDGDYNFEAGKDLKNRAFVGYKIPSATGDTAPWTSVSESNITSEKLPQLLGVSAKNEKDDGDEQIVDSAPAGGEAQFINTITNLGNGADTFNLTVANTNFPDGTTFSLWDETGNVPLGDTNGDGIIDTGLLSHTDADGLKIMVKAKLPAGKSGGPYTAVLTATSAGDVSISDTVTEKLTAITAESIDLANYKATEKDIVFSGEVTAITDFFKPGASPDYDPVGNTASVVSRAPGSEAEFGLYIANKSGTPSSFRIESVIDKTPGWKVTYIHDGIYKKDGTVITAATNRPITVTPNLPAESVMKVKAIVAIPADVNQAVAGDYAITFKATANATGMSNSTKNQITVTQKSDLEFGPEGANQVEPGGTSFYEHKLVNRGNTDLDVTFSTTTTLGDWNYLVYEKVGDKLNLITGAYPLAQGAEANIVVKVMAPATATPGFVFNLELTAADADKKAAATLTDSTTVIKGQIVLTKSVAKISDKGSYGKFETNLTERVKPGEKVVWKVRAVVQGSASAKNVIITDAAPPYTKLVTGGPIAGNPKVNDKAATTDQVVVSGSNITFYVGTGANANTPIGGEMAPGESVEVTFEVVLD